MARYECSNCSIGSRKHSQTQAAEIKYSLWDGKLGINVFTNRKQTVSSINMKGLCSKFVSCVCVSYFYLCAAGHTLMMRVCVWPLSFFIYETQNHVVRRHHQEDRLSYLRKEVLIFTPHYKQSGVLFLQRLKKRCHLVLLNQLLSTHTNQHSCFFLNCSIFI